MQQVLSDSPGAARAAPAAAVSSAARLEVVHRQLMPSVRQSPSVQSTIVPEDDDDAAQQRPGNRQPPPSPPQQHQQQFERSQRVSEHQLNLNRAEMVEDLNSIFEPRPPGFAAARRSLSRTSSSAHRPFGLQRVHMLHYAAVLVTLMVVLPALIAAHLLAPDAVSLVVLLLPAIAGLVQAISAPYNTNEYACRSFARNCCSSRWMHLPAGQLKAVTIAVALAPLVCISAFLMNARWLTHLSLLPLILITVVAAPRMWCLLSFSAQVHLELLLCCSYVFSVPYASSRSWFSCLVFCSAMCFFPVASYVGMRPWLARAMRVPRNYRTWRCGVSPIDITVGALSVGWALADILLVGDIFFVHLPVAPVPWQVQQPADQVTDPKVLAMMKQLKVEAWVLAAAMLLICLCGFCGLALIVQTEKWAGVLARTNSIQRDSVNDDLGLAVFSRAALQAEMKAKYEFVRDHLCAETVRSGHPALNVSCSICQDSMRIADGVVQLPHCRHCFHWSCLNRWLLRKVTCPNCQLDVHRALVEQLGEQEDRRNGQQQQQQQTSQQPIQTPGSREGPSVPTRSVPFAVNVPHEHQQDQHPIGRPQVDVLVSRDTWVDVELQHSDSV